MISPEHYQALRSGAALVDRSGRGRLFLTGADRATFLQGLLTNDIPALAPGTGCYAALLTANGRMVSDMRVFELGDRLLLDLDRAQAASMRERLDASIFSEDTQVTDVTAALAEIGVYGPRAAEAAAKAIAGGHAQDAPALGEMPVFSSRHAVFAGVPLVIVRSDDIGVEGFDLIVPASHAAYLQDAIRAAGAPDVSPDAVEACRIEGGVPLFGVDMDEDTIPLEAGIEGRAISLTKGCYVGQEIIIRVLHRGHGRVARRLVGLAVASGGVPPARGDRLLSAERVVGTVTSATDSPALRQPIALGYVHRDFTEPGTILRLESGNTVRDATVTALPFVKPAGSAG